MTARHRAPAQLDRPHRNAARRGHRRAAARAGGHARPRRPRSRGPATPCRRLALAVLPAAAPAVARSAPTATRSAAASCRRCRCRAACGPAAGCSSTQPLRVGDAIDAHARASPTSTRKAGPQRRRWSSCACATRSRDARGLALQRGARHRLPRRARSRATPRRRRSAAPADAAVAREIVPDDVLLFRYSALTFNGHRIHYDRRYVTEVEGYPGLVVHGPLIATLLLDLLRRELPDAHGARASTSAPCGRCSTSRRSRSAAGRRPDGKTVQLWAQDAEGCARDGRDAPTLRLTDDTETSMMNATRRAPGHPRRRARTCAASFPTSTSARSTSSAAIPRRSSTR